MLIPPAKVKLGIMTVQIPDTLTLDNPFWQFSLLLWEDKTLRALLLRLQDEHNQRINLLLFAIWLAKQHKVIKTGFKQLCLSSDTWHDRIVLPLRKARKELPKIEAVAMLKTQIQASELLAEQYEQALLFNCSLDIQTDEAENISFEERLRVNLSTGQLRKSDLSLLIDILISS